jgi:hypothetical protein
MGPLDAAQKVLVYGLAVALGVSMLGNVALWVWHSHTEERLQTCNTDKATLTGRIDTQNDMIERWKTDAEAAAEWGLEQRKKARDVSVAVQPRVDALQGRILASAGKTCDDALREIRRPAGANLPKSAISQTAP